MPIRIQRKRTNGWKMPPNTIYVGRPTKWGNPHKPEDWHGSVHEAVKQYWYMMLPQYFATPEKFEELRGKDLACWCPILDEYGNRFPCHADRLLTLLEIEVPYYDNIKNRTTTPGNQATGAPHQCENPADATAV